jgi:hypothetical protein
MKYIFILLISLLFIGCATKQPIKTKSATIIFKTPIMKFYDKGFINKYEDYTHLTIFNLGKVVLDLKIYQDQVCQGLLQCISTKEFNKKYLHSSYEDDFLSKLFRKEQIRFKDKENKIFIKATFDNQ